VPILKSNCNVYGKTVTVDDFRGVSISPVISKVFEHCVLDRYGGFFGSSDNQCGFKKNLGCASAAYFLQSVIGYYVALGSTVNICAVDLSKAFDKMNYHSIFIKLMERNILINLLMLLEHWFAIGVTCVKWGSIMSKFIGILCGIWHGVCYRLIFYHLY